MRSSFHVVAAAIVAALLAPSLACAADARAYSAGKYVLQLGNRAGYVNSIDGGNMRGEVATEPDGTKRIVRATPEPIRAQLGGDDEFLQIIAATLGDPGKIQPLNGSISSVDYSGKLISKRDFNDGVLTEIGFPAFDAASKDPAEINVTIQPSRSTEFGAGGPPPVKSPGPAQKRWLAMNFRMNLEAMPTTHVNKIEGITLSRKLASDPVGETRDYQKQPAGNWQVSNIVFYLTSTDALPYIKWAEDSLTRGNANDKKTLTIEALDSTLQNTILTLNCSGVGIVSVKPDAATAGSDAIRRHRVELFAEKVTLAPGKGASAAAPADPGATGGTGASAAGAAAGPGAPPPPPTDTPVPAGAAGTGATAAPAAASGTPAPAPAPTPTATRKKRPAATAPSITPVPVPIVPGPTRKAPH